MRTRANVRSPGIGWLYGGIVTLLITGAAGAKELDDPPASEETLLAGRELFARTWAPNDRRSHGGDGLGPVFNAQSCLGCHDQGGQGGAGPVERNIDIATAVGAGAQGSGFAYAFGMDFGSGRMEYKFANYSPGGTRREPPLDPRALATIHPGFRTTRSVVLHRFGMDPGYNTWREAMPGAHGTILVRTSQRNPTPLFGTGLIDAIPDEVIEAAAKRKVAGSTRVKGRAGRLKDGRIGRFGWKAQSAALAEFVLSAAATEIGLEVPGHHQAADPRLPGLGALGLDMNAEECDALIAYVRSLPAPVVRAPADATEAAQVKAGETTFKTIGCADCHLPRLGDVEGIYSDLLLHDMGPELGDTGSYGVLVAGPAGANGPAAAGGPRGEAGAVTSSEWRTPPLWGLRHSAPYLHDGRSATVDEAITSHGGQGTASARRYAQLSPRRKQQLESFLLSLSAPPEAEPPGLAQAP